MKQKLQFSILLLFINLFAFAQTFDSGNLRYTVISGTNVSVKKANTCPTGALNIPATVDYAGTTYSVTNIEFEAFSYNYSACTAITSVTIPNSVTTIGDFAFSSCSGLTTVNFSNALTNIGTDAFANCAALTSINLPNSLTTLSNGAFFGCTGLTTVNIPNSVTSIGNYAFGSCTGLTSFTVNWTTPLVITAEVFFNVNTSAIPLNVPSGSEALYEANAVWTTFNPINGFLGTEDFEATTKVSVYPNPSNGLFNLEAQNNATVTVFDMLGKQIATQKITVGTATINLSSVTAGIYFAKITTENNQTQTVKLIKQ